MGRNKVVRSLSSINTYSISSNRCISNSSQCISNNSHSSNSSSCSSSPLQHSQQQAAQLQQRMQQQQARVPSPAQGNSQGPLAAQPPTSPQGGGTPLPLAPPMPRPGLVTPINTPTNPATVQIQARPPSVNTVPHAPHVSVSAPLRPQQVSVRTAEAAPAVKRAKKRARPDNCVCEPAESLGHSPSLQLLHKLERRVDAALAQKYAALQEAEHRPQRVKKRLRVFVHSTHAQQGSKAALESAADDRPVKEPPSWQLCIGFRLVDVADAEGFVPPPAHPQNTQNASQGRSNNPVRLVKRLKVTTHADPAQAHDDKAASTATRDATLHEWDSQQHAGPLPDGFAVRGVGSKDVRVSIELQIESDTPKFKLARSLAQLIGKSTATRRAAERSLYFYIRDHGLLSEEDKGKARLDEPLQRVLNTVDKEARLTSISERINPLLQPLDPLRIEYTIRVGGPSPVPAEAHDIAVDILSPSVNPDSLNDPASIAAEKAALLRDTDTLDQQVSNLMTTLREHKRRHAMLMGFATSPVDFISGLLEEQITELRAAVGGPTGGYSSGGKPPLAMRGSDHFKGEWVEDAVLRGLWASEQGPMLRLLN
ncbi:hypothetical protein WJX73_004980 [Symbiochloris irregularis]|uniref:DM2 domain-containing protein n=1 Tax=Symbiochloris irregularis TaxID=706552 RepID=A0AAW1PC04_9CHLO